MSFARGQARRRAPSTRALVVLAVLGVAVVAAVSAPAASADQLSSKRAQAQAAEAHLTELQNEAERKIEAYDAVHQKFVTTRNSLRLNRQSLRVAKSNLKAAEQRLQASLTETYKNGGEDALSYLLAARSIGELVDQVQVMQRVNGINKTLLNQVTLYKSEIQNRQTLLAKQLKTVRVQQAASARAKAQVLGALAHQRSYISNLKASIQHIIDARQAAAAAAAQTAASSTGTTLGDFPAPPSSTLGGQAVAIAEQYLGVPYVWGGASPSGFDCSGLASYAYAQIGKSVPHYTGAIWSAFPHVPAGQEQVGDLVFFNGLGHMGIYIGGGQFVHAPHTGDVVRVANLGDRSDYIGAVRP
jgi:cell wall-associated NlpC family hydrolase